MCDARLLIILSTIPTIGKISMDVLLYSWYMETLDFYQQLTENLATVLMHYNNHDAVGCKCSAKLTGIILFYNILRALAI